jgi:hypothetical protein
MLIYVSLHPLRPTVIHTPLLEPMPVQILAAD